MKKMHARYPDTTPDNARTNGGQHRNVVRPARVENQRNPQKCLVSSPDNTFGRMSAETFARRTTTRTRFTDDGGGNGKNLANARFLGADNGADKGRTTADKCFSTLDLTPGQLGVTPTRPLDASLGVPSCPGSSVRAGKRPDSVSTAPLTTILAPPMPPPPYREQPTPRRRQALDRSRQIKAELRKPAPVQPVVVTMGARRAVDHAEVVRLSADGAMSSRQIADRMGCTQAHVNKLVRTYGSGEASVREHPVPEFDRQAVIEAFLAGATLIELVDRYGVSRDKIRAPLRSAGLVP